MNKIIYYSVLLLFILAGGGACGTKRASSGENYISYEVDLEKQDLELYWKDDNGQPFRSIGRLKAWLEGKGQTLVFAMNAGMYKRGNTPQGLLIQDFQQLVPLDTASGRGNFYLKPNGVFYTTREKKAFIVTTENFRSDSDIQLATQSGPVLLARGRIHPAFTKGSKNGNIRNGVGILPNGKVLFAMSVEEVNLYDFATYFRDRGCREALYLDGLVSRTYLPEKQWMQTDGDFGAIIAVTAGK
ncbi:MAG TPA: phosphodiester glycosidase family protein [Flavisolibacter sp.]|nr:phosphodiester glycosidase family protein [Flavisolibacter sp.]